MLNDSRDAMFWVGVVSLLGSGAAAYAGVAETTFALFIAGAMCTIAREFVGGIE